MSLVQLEHVLELAEQLEPTEQMLLVAKLLERRTGSVTREMLLAEFERRKQSGAFAHEESFYGEYAAEPSSSLSFEDIQAAIHEYSWEDELDEFY
jgi:hypothetical protein